MRERCVARLRTQAGFSLVELMVVVAIMSVLAAITIVVSPAFTEHARAEAGTLQAMDALRLARETAISQRRNVQVRFVGLTAIQTAREDIAAGGTVTGTTILRTAVFENRMKFELQPGVPDTPDRFGNTSALAFGVSPARMFTSEGTFVDQQGDVLNGTIFLSIPGNPLSARAITIFGPTALIRAWQWNGHAWVE